MWDSVYICYSTIACKVWLNWPQYKIGQHDDIVSFCWTGASGAISTLWTALLDEQFLYYVMCMSVMYLSLTSFLNQTHQIIELLSQQWPELQSKQFLFQVITRLSPAYKKLGKITGIQTNFFNTHLGFICTFSWKGIRCYTNIICKRKKRRNSMSKFL